MQVAADRTDASTAIQTDLPAIFASLELSRSTWLITSLSPGARRRGEDVEAFDSGRRCGGLARAVGPAQGESARADGAGLSHHRHPRGRIGRLLDPPRSAERRNRKPRCRCRVDFDLPPPAPSENRRDRWGDAGPHAFSIQTRGAAGGVELAALDTLQYGWRETPSAFIASRMGMKPSPASLLNRAMTSRVIRMRHGAPGVSCSPWMIPALSKRWRVEGATPSTAAHVKRSSRIAAVDVAIGAKRPVGARKVAARPAAAESRPHTDASPDWSISSARRMEQRRPPPRPRVRCRLRPSTR